MWPDLCLLVRRKVNENHYLCGIRVGPICACRTRPIDRKIQEELLKAKISGASIRPRRQRISLQQHGISDMCREMEYDDSAPVEEVVCRVDEVPEGG